jgi:ubiquinone/menaquinone biosynthesis C-methylase UbiE
MATEGSARTTTLAWRAFAVPRGLAGNVGGRVMAWLNAPVQREVVELLAVRPGDRVLEVGHGPGTLLRLLAEHTDASLVAGVDPSPVMRRQAAGRCRAATTAGRVEVAEGTATGTGYPDGSFDHVVSVNNLVFWGDLMAGCRESHRVLRPGGRLVVAFHSRTARAWHERRLGLPEEVVVQLQAAVTATFGGAVRHDLTHVVAVTATRGG